MTPSNMDKQWQQAQNSFADRQAARNLAKESAMEPQTSTGLSASTLISIAREGSSPAQLFATLNGPVPMNAIKLYRALLSRTSIGTSLHAKAASTQGQVERELGPYHMEVVIDDDAAFLIIDLNENPSPRSCVLLHEDGRNKAFDFAAPVDDVLQFGISRNNPQYDSMLDLLTDPVTSIYLQ